MTTAIKNTNQSNRTPPFKTQKIFLECVCVCVNSDDGGITSAFLFIRETLLSGAED